MSSSWPRILTSLERFRGSLFDKGGLVKTRDLMLVRYEEGPEVRGTLWNPLWGIVGNGMEAVLLGGVEELRQAWAPLAPIAAPSIAEWPLWRRGPGSRPSSRHGATSSPATLRSSTPISPTIRQSSGPRGSYITTSAASRWARSAITSTKTCSTSCVGWRRVLEEAQRRARSDQQPR